MRNSSSAWWTPLSEGRPCHLTASRPRSTPTTPYGGQPSGVTFARTSTADTTGSRRPGRKLREPPDIRLGSSHNGAHGGNDAWRRYPGDTTTCFAWRREAEHLLDMACEAWAAEHVASVTMSGEAVVSPVWPTSDVVLSVVASDILERRRWRFGARREFQDRDAFRETSAYWQSIVPSRCGETC